VLLAVLAGVHGVSAIVLAAALIAGFELANMARANTLQRLRYLIPVAALASAGVAGAIGGSTATTAALWTAVAIGAGSIAWFTIRPPTDHQSVPRTARHANRHLTIILGLAALYFGATLAHAPALAAETDGTRWVLMAILGTFAVDTGAYFTGRAVGHRLLAPNISPKKTWEGVAGGALAAVGAIIALGAVLDLPIAVWQASVIGIALATAGVAGDLVESWLKRRAGVKDSGRLIPGHGGILDRIDSLAPNLVVVYWVSQLIGN
jgi:phosphatidate cytidylyltransferase